MSCWPRYPAAMLNQNPSDSGIPNRFCLKPSRSSVTCSKPAWRVREPRRLSDTIESAFVLFGSRWRLLAKCTGCSMQPHPTRARSMRSYGAAEANKKGRTVNLPQRWHRNFKRTAERIMYSGNWEESPNGKQSTASQEISRALLPPLICVDRQQSMRRTDE